MLRRPVDSALRPPVAMMDQAAPMVRTAIVERLFQGIEDEAGMGSPAGPPASGPPTISIDDERDVDEPRPGRDIQPALAQVGGKSDTQSLFGVGAKDWRLT